MTPERFQEIDRVLCLALEREPSERAIFLEQACRGDEELREEVRSLLDSHEGAGDFLVEPPSDAAAELLAHESQETKREKGLPPAPLPNGAAVGRYVVTGVLGGGGMGLVYAGVRGLRSGAEPQACHQADASRGIGPDGSA